MPTYEYACTSCGERLEVVQRFSDDPLTECPACSGALRKVFSAVGVVFKGSGFYKTDSRPSGSKSSASTEPAKTDTGTGTEKAAKPAAESKPAATTPSDKPAPKPSSSGSTDRVA
jgi:putative FmdB family regulatory protein